MSQASFTALTNEQLRTLRCRHMTAADQLGDAAITAQLQATPQWRHEDGALRRTYTFANFYETMAFVNAIAWIFHREDHHADLNVTYNQVSLAFNTHSANGISLNDFICAAKVDEVFGQ